MRPSGLSAHDSARLLPIFCPGNGRTSASWSAYRMPNGVICGGAVDGSNQLGAMVMGQAITASPAGDGWPVTARAAPSVSMPSTRSSTTRLSSRLVTILAICFSPLKGRAFHYLITWREADHLKAESIQVLLHPWKGIGLVRIVIEPTDGLIRYQQKLIDAVAPFTVS